MESSQGTTIVHNGEVGKVEQYPRSGGKDKPKVPCTQVTILAMGVAPITVRVDDKVYGSDVVNPLALKLQGLRPGDEVVCLCRTRKMTDTFSMDELLVVHSGPASKQYLDALFNPDLEARAASAGKKSA